MHVLLNGNDLAENAYSAFILDSFDYQKRNLTFVKTDFQVLKLKFDF